MATNRWRGDAPPIARVITLAVGGTVADGDTVSYTIGNATVTATAETGDDEAAVAAKLYAALVASGDPRFQEVSWTYTELDDFVTGTAAVAGVPWAGTPGDTGTTTLTETEATASSGPNHVDEPLNWSQAGLPAPGEDVLVDGGADLLYGFENLSAAALGSLRVKASFANGKMGLPVWNANGYYEYRGRAFPLDTAVPVTVGEGEGAGPARVYLDVDTALSCVVHRTAAREDAAVPVVNITGCASGTLTVASGDVSLAADDDTAAATVGTLTADNDAAVYVGKGAAVTTANVRADAAVTCQGAVTTLNATGGTTTLFAAPTTVTADGACRVALRFAGTVTTLTARGQGAGKAPVVDCGLDPRGRTFTNHTFVGGAALLDPDQTTTWTNAGTWDRESLAASDLGSRFSLQRT